MYFTVKMIQSHGARGFNNKDDGAPLNHNILIFMIFSKRSLEGKNEHRIRYINGNNLTHGILVLVLEPRLLTHELNQLSLIMQIIKLCCP